VFLRLGGRRSFADPRDSAVGGDERSPWREWIDWISRAQHEGAAIAHLDNIALERRLHTFNSATPGDDDALPST
jgi:hypothetical protein